MRKLFTSRSGYNETLSGDGEKSRRLGRFPCVAPKVISERKILTRRCVSVIRALFYVEKVHPFLSIKNAFQYSGVSLSPRNPFPHRVALPALLLGSWCSFSRAHNTRKERTVFGALAEEGRKSARARFFTRIPHITSPSSCPTTTRKCPPRCKT